jgi:Flp pilus assembly protein TadD
MRIFKIITIMAAVLLSLVGCATTQQNIAPSRSDQNSMLVAEQPEIAKAYSDRGLIKLLVHDDYTGAIDDFAIAIGYKPSEASYHVCRGLAYLKNGNNTDAKVDFNKAASLDPSLSASLESLLKSSR